MIFARSVKFFTLFVFASLLFVSPVFAETDMGDETDVMEDDSCWT